MFVGRRASSLAIQSANPANSPNSPNSTNSFPALERVSASPLLNLLLLAGFTQRMDSGMLTVELRSRRVAFRRIKRFADMLKP